MSAALALYRAPIEDSFATLPLQRAVVFPQAAAQSQVIRLGLRPLVFRVSCRRLAGMRVSRGARESPRHPRAHDQGVWHPVRLSGPGFP